MAVGSSTLLHTPLHTHACTLNCCSHAAPLFHTSLPSPLTLHFHPFTHSPPLPFPPALLTIHCFNHSALLRSAPLLCLPLTIATTSQSPPCPHTHSSRCPRQRLSIRPHSRPSLFPFIPLYSTFCPPLHTSQPLQPTYFTPPHPLQPLFLLVTSASFSPLMRHSASLPKFHSTSPHMHIGHCIRQRMRLSWPCVSTSFHLIGRYRILKGRHRMDALRLKMFPVLVVSSSRGHCLSQTSPFKLMLRSSSFSRV